uniref:Uncharacterized protein n=1 Tax=Moniliophthora roreri TaxID=221103 RepID=A0A0W0FG50_MONRR
MSSVPQRKIGDATVPAIGFGVMGIATAYGKIDTDEERLKTPPTKLAARSGTPQTFTVILKISSENGHTTFLMVIHGYSEH